MNKNTVTRPDPLALPKSDYVAMCDILEQAEWKMVMCKAVIKTDDTVGAKSIRNREADYITQTEARAIALEATRLFAQAEVIFDILAHAHDEIKSALHILDGLEVDEASAPDD